MSASESTLFVIGVGGSGCRMAQEVLHRNPSLPGVLLDTCASDLPDAPAPSVLFGANRLNGKGTGGQSASGRDAFRDDQDTNILGHIPSTTRLAVILVGLGGGTGSGATPELVKALRARGVTTLCVATLPLALETQERKHTANAILSVLEGCSDGLIRVPLDSLVEGMCSEPLIDVLASVQTRLAEVVACFWKLLSQPGFLALDEMRLLQFLRTKGGGATLRLKSAEGTNRLETLLSWLSSGGSFSESFKQAHSVLLGIVAGADLRLAEVGEIVSTIRQLKPASAMMEFGTVLDSTHEGSLEIVVLLFDSWSASANATQSSTNSDEFPQVKPANTRGSKHIPRRTTSSAGRFRDVEPTFDGSVNLDIPTFRRRGCSLDY